MVATMSQAFSLAYYLHNQRSLRHPTEYYAPGEEPDGVWFNPNSLFGLTDAKSIDSKHFHRLYNGFHPETGDKLTQNAGTDKRSPGLDITFSADKSVSALWAIADEALTKQLEEAHNAASRIALQEVFLRKCSLTRIRVGGKDGDIQIIPAKLLGAMFQQGTSRAGDPLLHTHCVIFNAVRANQDGKWRALHQTPFYYRIKISGACYRAHLASYLTELGIRMERYGKDNAYVRIQNIPKDLQEMWSKRRSELTTGPATTGSQSAHRTRLTPELAKRARESRRPGQYPDLRRIRWQIECESLHEPTTVVASVLNRND